MTVLKGFTVIVLASIVFLSGQAAGVAGKAECKEKVQVKTGWAVPPPTVKKDQLLMVCVQDYLGVQGSVPNQRCYYSDEKNEHCTVMLDIPGEERWKSLAIDCKSGEPIKEQKL